jgi:hypothetical protein
MRHDPFRPAIDEAIPIVECRFSMLFSDTPAALELMRAGLKFKGAKDVEGPLSLFSKMNMFSEELLEAMVSGGESYKPAAVAFIWERLVAARLVRRSFGSNWRAIVDHQLDLFRILGHLRDDTFRNLFSAPAELASRYACALLAVDVTKADGAEARGSGFLIVQDERPWLVTCRHNVDPADGVADVRISDVDGAPVAIGAPILSPDHDIALYRVADLAGPAFRLTSDLAMFDEVFTLGYPCIPGAQSLVVGHRGEVNGLADLYLQRTPALLISNLVAPGSSGCPVLLKDGHCVGMTMRWLVGQYDSERLRYSAALPASVILDFIKSTVGRA